ncbi:MAG: hypothetical protein ACLUAR_03020 [Pilosibacter sp.]
MKAVLNGKEMKEFDARSIKGYGIPSLVLMERAAMAVAEKAEKILERRGRDRLVRLRLWK